ncbi:hypothetical protein GQ600_9931 [Phytophthora cactorum]|nr:hypothetical protein GQ600_9931 [Phytophthora cactorum]
MGGRLDTSWFENTGFELLAVDVNALTIACSQLENLTLSDVKVIMSGDSEALRNWPLKTLLIDAVVSGVPSYLSDAKCRMARGLIDIRVDVPRDWNFSDEMAEEMKTHDGDFCVCG